MPPIEVCPWRWREKQKRAANRCDLRPLSFPVTVGV